jgi:predicted transcriptional regulator
MLTEEKREEIKKVLKQVNVSEICATLKINRTGIWRTLNGKGRMYDELEQVVKVAREQQSKLESKLQSL